MRLIVNTLIMNNINESLLIRIVRGVIGIVFIIGVCILLSENKKKFPGEL